MMNPAHTSSDVARLAAEIRSLAFEARRVMAGPASSSEARELVRMIARLEAQAPGRMPNELARWLENLRRQLAGHAAA